MRSFLFVLALVGLASHSAADPAAQRIVAVGSAVTEIVYALGEGDRLVARDSTSYYPPEALDLPNVGYLRALSPEGVLSVNPDLVLAAMGSGPPQTMEVLHAARLEVVQVPENFTAENVLEKIAVIAAAIGAEDSAAALIDQVRAEMDETRALVESIASEDAPKVLFIISAANGRLIAGGEASAADGILKLAGARNAMTGFKGFKPVSEEAVIQAAPDAILMMNRTGPHAISAEDLFNHTAIAPTPAGQTRTLITMDGAHLLGFGPRIASTVADLAQALHAPGGS